MTSKVASHFEEYKEQTRLKHEILVKYLKPYFAIRGNWGHDNLVYIDAFAGCGEYQSGAIAETGSPIKALEMLLQTKPAIYQRITTIFIEENPGYFAKLTEVVDRFNPVSKGLRQPSLYHGTFETHVGGLLSALKSQNSQLAPSFLFADPCGVDGLGFETLARYLLESSGEAFLFFNYNGVSRIAGLGYKPGKTLSRLLGSDERAQALVAALEGKTAPQKEEIIVSAYMQALGEDIPDLYVTAFRIEYETKRATSHYLIHLTRNELGFRLMKEVMWPLGRTAEGEGALALEQASLTGSRPLFKAKLEEIKRSIVTELRNASGSLVTRYFYETLSCQRGNQLCKPAYKVALLELEREGTVVMMKNGVIKKASERMRKNSPTLGDDYIVKLVK